MEGTGKSGERCKLQQAGNGPAMEVTGPPDDIVMERHGDDRGAILLVEPELQQLCVRRKLAHRHPLIGG